MMTCSKIYPNFPFAHRQPNHDGHCRLVHGHNWTFEFTFACHARDESGFVVDFGKLGFIKEFLNFHFDHTIVLSTSDPQLGFFRQYPELFKVIELPDASCEGLAEFVFDWISVELIRQFGGRVVLQEVVVREDSKNFTRYSK